jgi:hypothetical protein
MKVFILFLMSFVYLAIALAAQILKQRTGAFAGQGIGTSLTRKVFPDPVRNLFFALPYIITAGQNAINLLD